MDKQQTLALAESCTGGYISHRVTRVAGSSGLLLWRCGNVFQRSEDTLSGRPPRNLGKTRRRQSRNGLRNVGRHQTTHRCRRRAERHGSGGSCGWQHGEASRHGLGQHRSKRSHEAKLFRFAGDRERIILGTSQVALNWLRTSLLNEVNVRRDSRIHRSGDRY